MKQFASERKSRGQSGPDADVAAAVLDVSMRVARSTRRALQRTRPAGLSLSLVRGLTFLAGVEGATLSAVADSLSMGMASASKLIEELVARGLVRRRVAAGDRRCLALDLTEAGRHAERVAMGVALEHLGALLSPLSAANRTRVRQAMELVQPLLLDGLEAARGQD